MKEFKVGDRVVHVDDGDKGTVTGIDEYIYEVNFDQDGMCWVNDFEIDLISNQDGTDTPSEHFAKTAAKFATDPLSTDDIEALTTLGEQLGISSFEQSVHRVTGKIADLLIAKNKAYGDSALNPVRIFSKSDRMEQLYTRIDDKISRVQRGTEFRNEDTISDLAGYLILVLIARESE